MNMRRIAAIIILAAIIMLVSASVFAETQPNDFLGVSLSWDLSVKLCYQHQFNEVIGIKASVGTYLFIPMFIIDDSFAIVEELLAVFSFFPLDNPFQMRLGLGVPVSSVVFYPDDDGNRVIAFTVSPGADLYAGWRFKGGQRLGLWLGAGYPFVYDAGRTDWGLKNSPLGLWPDLDIEFIWPLYN